MSAYFVTKYSQCSYVPVFLLQSKVERSETVRLGVVLDLRVGPVPQEDANDVGRGKRVDGKVERSPARGITGVRVSAVQQQVPDTNSRSLIDSKIIISRGYFAFKLRRHEQTDANVPKKFEK
jgi:hypothetical protein